MNWSALLSAALLVLSAVSLIVALTRGVTWAAPSFDLVVLRRADNPIGFWLVTAFWGAIAAGATIVLGMSFMK